MKWFDDLFTPPTSPEREIDPCENILNQVRSLDDERHDARAWLFMNQLRDAEAGNVGLEQGATGGQTDVIPPPPTRDSQFEDLVL